MHHSGITGWRWIRPTWIVAVWAAGFAPTLTCAEDWRTPGAQRRAVEGNPQSSSSSANQATLNAANQFGTMLGQLLRGDPQKAARLAAEAQARTIELQRTAEIAAAEAERQKQQTYSRLRGELKLDSFDGESGGGLVLKGVDVGSEGGLGPKSGDSGNELGLKLGDDDLKPRGTQAAANSGPPESPAPNTDPMVVDLRNYQRAAYVASLPDASPEAIVAAAQGDTAVITMPPPNAATAISGAGLTQFQLANDAYHQSHEDGDKAAMYFNRAQALREIAGRELGSMKADLERQLAQTEDKGTLAEKQQMMGQIFATARAEHEAWVSAKAEVEATRAREAFDKAMLLRTVSALKSGAAPSATPPPPAASANPTTERSRRLEAMSNLAKIIAWPADEQERLKNAFAKLALDGDQNVTGAQIEDTWLAVRARGGKEYAGEAANGDGPGFPGAGLQTLHSDCTIFALANATGLPYGVVASRAALLLGNGDWRSPAERAHPQQVIEDVGLNGDEVIMLAESFGQAEVVTSAEFARTLHEGRTVLVDVFPQSTKFTKDQPAPGHQVVLTKAFSHGGETWFEMMDSNQGPMRRLYLSAKELNIMLIENGVAYRPDPETVPVLLRLADSK